MKRYRALVPVVVALGLIALLGVLGPWAQPAAPQLVQVRDVVPRDVEPGDRIAVMGAGFPAGKPARVAFRGTLHRPGERPMEDAEIVVSGTVVSPEEVEVTFVEATQALFCGAGDHATHTTFEGDIEVAFAAASPGAPPVAGTLRHASLDVRPSSSALDRDRGPEGDRVLAFVGIQVTPGVRRSLGLAVEAVAPGSRAEAAGIAPGDVITSFDGVRVASAEDVVPPAGEREALVGVRSGVSTLEAVRPLAVDGFRRAPLAEILGAAIFVVAALAILFLFGLPLRPGLATALARAASRVRARIGLEGATGGARAPSSRRGEVARSLFGAAMRDALPPAVLPALVDAAACAVLVAMPFGQYLVAASLDVGVLFVAAVAALAVTAFLAAGSGWRGLRASVQVAWQHVPAAIGVAGIVLTTGSLRVQEIERAQGGWPWDWLAFRSPATLLALGLLLACGCIEPAPGAPVRGVAALIEAPDRAHGSSELPALGPWVEATRRAHRFVVAGLASALFLGGWSLPGLSAAQQDAHLAFQVAGVVVLVAKTAALVLALTWVRLGLPRWHLSEGTRVTALWLLPAAVVTLVATAAWTCWGPERGAQLLISGSLVAVAALVALAVGQRVHHGLVSPGGDGHLSSFL